MEYFSLKWIHILSSTILFGTGLGSAFFMFVANRRKNINEIYFAVRTVVIADWIFTSPAIVIQLVTGILLMQSQGFTLEENWLALALFLYFFTGACWLPVVYLQIKMRDMAKHSLEKKTLLPELYWKMDRYWILLGSLAFPAVVVIFYLMVFKPEF